MKKRGIAVLASGGLDSNVLISELLRKYDEVYPIYIRCGFVWEKAELFWLKRYLKAIRKKRLKSLRILELPVVDLDPEGWAVTGRGTPGYRSSDEEVFLPGRNLLLLSKAATFCALKKIPILAVGSLSGNPFPDATASFFKTMSRAASEALGSRLRIVAPFQKLKKKEVLRRGKGLPLHLSFSCLVPKGLKSCGRCNKCAERERVQR